MRLPRQAQMIRTAARIKVICFIYSMVGRTFPHNTPRTRVRPASVPWLWPPFQDRRMDRPCLRRTWRVFSIRSPLPCLQEAEHQCRLPRSDHDSPRSFQHKGARRSASPWRRQNSKFQKNKTIPRERNIFSWHDSCSVTSYGTIQSSYHKPSFFFNGMNTYGQNRCGRGLQKSRRRNYKRPLNGICRRNRGCSACVQARQAAMSRPWSGKGNTDRPRKRPP